MKVEIKSRFLGVVQGVEIRDEVAFNSAVHIFRELQERYPNVIITEELVKEYTSELEYHYIKDDNFVLAEYEYAMITFIDTLDEDYLSVNGTEVFLGTEELILDLVYDSQ